MRGVSGFPRRCGAQGLMSNPVIVALYVAALAAVVVGVDVAFFRGHVWARLLVNIGIVLVFAAFWLRFRDHP